MKVLLLVLAVLCNFGAVTAYGDAGAYERMFFYYAYLVDTQGGTKTATKIATGCSKVMKVGNGAPCSFNQFIQYIEGAGGKDSSRYQVTSERIPPLQTTADSLSAKELTGAYQFTLVRGDVSNSGGLAALIDSVSGYLKGTIASADEGVQNALRNSIEAVSNIRQANALETVENHFKDNDLEFRRGTRPVFTGNANTVDCIDMAQTESANPGKSRKDLGGAIQQAMKGQKGHAPNMKAAIQAKSALDAACS